MQDQLYEALKILLVGMTTVFFILSIVVFLGNALIALLNRTDFVLNKKPSKDIPENVQTAIELAIAKWSNGRAKIKEINKAE